MVGDLFRKGSAALALALTLGLPAVQAAERVVRYSGKVERVDLDEGVVVVDEMAARGHRRRHLHVSPETPIVTAERLRPWEMRGSSAFEEIAVSLLDVITGDFVVVESTEEGGRLVAVRITIVDNRRRQ